MDRLHIRGGMTVIIFDDKSYRLLCCDGAAGLKEIEKGTVKLIYGSPPYPNAERNYGVWKEKDYIELISPFIDGAQHALSDDGFLVINVKANRSKKLRRKHQRDRWLLKNSQFCLKNSGAFRALTLRYGSRATLHQRAFELRVRMHTSRFCGFPSRQNGKLT